MYKTIRNAVEIFAITLILSFILFYGVNIDFLQYLGVVSTIFVAISICFFFWRQNQKFYLIFIISALLNLSIFLFQKYNQGYWICWDKTDIAYIVYSSVLGLLLIITIIFAFLRKQAETKILNNYFSERRYDLERLHDYLHSYSVVGLESSCGD